MSITTLGLQESMLLHERPLAWWGLDTADPTVDDARYQEATGSNPGDGYTLTALAAPSNSASLHTRGDSGASGSRDFNGTTQGYWTNGTIYEAPVEYPTFVCQFNSIGTGGNGPINITTPYGPSLNDPPGWEPNTLSVQTGDLMIGVFNSSTNGATMSTTPAGWTQLGSTTNYTQGTFAVFWRVATSIDEMHPRYTWQWSAATDWSGGVSAWRNVDPATLILDFGLQATASSLDHSSTSENVATNPTIQLVFLAGDFTGDLTPQESTSSGARTRIFTLDASVTELGWGSSLKSHLLAYEYKTGDTLYRTAATSPATTLGVAMITFASPSVVARDDLDAITGDLTIGCLINVDTVAAGSRTIVRKEGSWILQVDAATLKFFYHDGTAYRSHSAAGSLSTGTTYRIWVKDDGTTITFFVNGTKSTVARFNALPYATNTNRVTLAHFWNGAAASEFLDGRIDELAIFVGSTPLTDQQIVAFEQAATQGTFGTRLLGKPNYPALKLEIAFGSNPSDGCFAFSNVTSYLRQLSTQRGRNFERDRVDTGTMSFALDDRARAFDDTNTSSPFYPNVKPTRAVRLRAQVVTDGVIYPIFFGYTEGHPLRRRSLGMDEVAEFTASDSFKALVLDKIEGEEIRPAELTGDRLEAVLAGVPGVPFVGDAGQVEIPLFDLNGSNRLEHAQTVVETDGGVLFAGENGYVVFQDKHYRTKNERTVRATYGSHELPFTNVEPETDEARLFTAAAITPSSGTVQTGENTAASTSFFKRTKELTTLHVSDNEALAMAHSFSNNYSVPRTRIPSIALAPVRVGQTMWAIVLGHEISHRIKTVDRPFGATINREQFVEGISHAITPSDWRVSLSVSPYELGGAFLLIGTGKIGDDGGATSGTIGW